MGFSLQEILSKTEKQRQEVERNMDQSHGGFHPDEASIYTGLGADDRKNIHETLQQIPLPLMLALAHAERNPLKPSIQEYIGHSGALTTGFTGVGMGGFNYLLPDKIYTTLFDNARCEDITPLVSNIVECPGAQLKLDVEVDGSFTPNFVASGGEAPDETIQTTQGTITPRLFNINVAITNEMIEDQLFDVMATHLATAGKAMGEFSTKMCLFPIMDDHRAGATTYRIEGAYNTFNTGGAAVLDWTDITEGWANNNEDGFKSDVAILAPKAPSTLLAGAVGYPHALERAVTINLNQNPITNWNGIDIVVTSHLTTSDAPAAVQWYSGLYSGHWHALIVNKTYGIQTVRKRWLKIENYSDPIKDLVGAVISARQGHLVAYADACCVASYA